MDFQRHLDQGENLGLGAVDYDVPPGVPIVPASSGRVFKHAWGNGKYVKMDHGTPHKDHYFVSTYLHLSESFRLDQFVTSGHIIGLSGATMDPGVNQGPHLHHAIEKAYKATSKAFPGPGIDPFTTGIDGGRPTYWDGKTRIYYSTVPIDNKRIEPVFVMMPGRLRFEEDVDADLKNELLELRNDPLSLRKLLIHKVLEKTPGPNGPNYKYLPGTYMYELMINVLSNTKGNQDYLTTLTMIHPLLKNHYVAKNVDLVGLTI